MHTHTVFLKRIVHRLGGFGFFSPLSTHKTSLFLLKVEPRRVSSHFRTQTISLKPQRQIMELQSSLPSPWGGEVPVRAESTTHTQHSAQEGDPSARSPLYFPPVCPARPGPHLPLLRSPWRRGTLRRLKRGRSQAWPWGSPGGVRGVGWPRSPVSGDAWTRRRRNPGGFRSSRPGS